MYYIAILISSLISVYDVIVTVNTREVILHTELNPVMLWVMQMVGVGIACGLRMFSTLCASWSLIFLRNVNYHKLGIWMNTLWLLQQIIVLYFLTK